MAPRAAPSATNTGSKDSKGRTIYRRDKEGTMFVKTVGPDGTMKRSAPAMGRKPIGPGAISLQRNTGRQNARGNPIWMTATGLERARRTSKSGAMYFAAPYTTEASARVYHPPRPKYGPMRSTGAYGQEHNTGRQNARGNPIWITSTGSERARMTSAAGKTYYAKPYMRTARSVVQGRAIRTGRSRARAATQHSATGFLNSGGRPVLAAPGGGYYVHNSAAKHGIRRLAKKDAFATHFMNM